MKKVVRLTEFELSSLIKKLISEDESSTSETSGGCYINCMPGPTSKSVSQEESKSKSACCSKQKPFSKECANYISKYRKDLEDCDKIDFVF